jgi:hypothetical protein
MPRNFAAKGQLTKANQTKTKMENLARELQKASVIIQSDVWDAHHFIRIINDYE